MKHIYSGKVRDVYQVDDDRLLLVTSDRISAFDVIMDQPVPGKGRALTALTAFWAGELSKVAPSHLLEVGLPADVDLEAAGVAPSYAEGRSMLVRRARMLPLECIVRGYLSGSAWAEYKRSGTMHGTALPAGMLQSQQLAEPVFTPSTKATVGHDENISFDQAAALVGAPAGVGGARDLRRGLPDGSRQGGRRGIIIADTKFELGLIDGELAICDEVLTPDSSRFWPVAQWRPGSAPPSFDKQPLRDWLEESGWDKRPPPPALPPDVVAATRSRYIAAYELLTGLSFADWPGGDGGPGPGSGPGSGPDQRQGGG